jgi:choline dehydrogenase-like flavoprotein
VANRLSEDFNVLLLEAGGEPTPLSAVPALALLMLGQPNIDWGYRTVPQTAGCLSMNNRVSFARAYKSKNALLI